MNFVRTKQPMPICVLQPQLGSSTIAHRGSSRVARVRSRTTALPGSWSVALLRLPSVLVPTGLAVALSFGSAPALSAAPTAPTATAAPAAQSPAPAPVTATAAGARARSDSAPQPGGTAAASAAIAPAADAPANPQADAAANPQAQAADAPASPQLKAAADLAALHEEANTLRKTLEADLATQDRGVQAIETDFGAFDRRLVDALVQQGRALHALSRYGQAVDVFERARHITRVNEGLYNIEQLAIIDATANSMAASNRWRDATNLKEYALAVARRHYGDDDPQLVPALYNLGGWYEHSGNVFGAREMYENANKILAKHVGADDVRRAEALRRLANSYRLERFPEHQFADDDARFDIDTDIGAAGMGHPLRAPKVINRFGPGERALKDAVQIYSRQTPPDAKRMATTLAELGDWYSLFGMWNRALAAYKEALNQSGTDRTALFGAVRTIYWRAPLSPERPPLDSIPERHGYVEMIFDVSERGDVTTARVSRAAPAGFMDDKALQALRAARYRPRFDDAGQPLGTAGLKFRYEFVYYHEPRT